MTSTSFNIQHHQTLLCAHVMTFSQNGKLTVEDCIHSRRRDFALGSVIWRGGTLTLQIYFTGLMLASLQLSATPRLSRPSAECFHISFKGLISSVFGCLICTQPVYTVENETWAHWNRWEPYINQGWGQSCFHKANCICAATIQVQYIQFLVINQTVHVNLYNFPLISTLTRCSQAAVCFLAHAQRGFHECFKCTSSSWLIAPRP